MAAVATTDSRNILWAEKLAGGALGLLRRDSAEAFLANQLAASIAAKEAWRVEYLLTKPLVFRHGLAQTTINPKNGINAAFRKVKWEGTFGQRKKPRKLYSALNRFGGMAPLTHAVRANFAEGVKILIAQGAGPVGEKDTLRGDDAYYHPAMQVALQFGHVDCLKAMLDSDTFKKDMADRPARVRGFLMEWGIKGGHVASLNALLEYDSAVLDHVAMPLTGFHQKFKAKGALELAVSHDVKPAIFDIVLARKSTVDPAFLFQAIEEKNEYAAAALVKAGVNIESRDAKTGATPLLLAAKADMRGLTALLIDNKADTSARDKGGKDLLAYGAKSYRTPMVDLLLEKVKFKASRLLKAAKRAHRMADMARSLKVAAFGDTGTAVDADSAWQVTGKQQVSVISKDAAAGFALTETFNFATQTHLILSRNPDTLKDDILLREDFATMKNQQVLKTAAQYLPKP